MLSNEEKVAILEKALIEEMFEHGDLGHFPHLLTGARIIWEHFDHRLVQAFRVEWNDDQGYFDIRSNANSR